MKRRQFVLFGGAAALIPLAACGDDDDDDNGAGGAGGSGGTGGGGTTAGAGSGGTAGTGGSANGGACTTDIASTSTLEDDHDHSVTIPLADIVDAQPGTFSFSVVAGHSHTIALTAEDFETLKSGDSVTKTSSVETGAIGPHDHDVTLSCS